VGKTTLAKKIAKVTGLPYLDETARQVAQKYKFKTVSEIAKAGQRIKEFQLDVFVKQLKAEWTHQNGFVSCRSVLDVVAYSIFCNNKSIDEPWVQGLCEFAISLTADYDLVAYCPIVTDEVENDGFRLTDKQSQEDVDKILKGLLKHSKAKITIVLGKNRDLWVQEVSKAITETVGNGLLL